MWEYIEKLYPNWFDIDRLGHSLHVPQLTRGPPSAWQRVSMSSFEAVPIQWCDFESILTGILEWHLETTAFVWKLTRATSKVERISPRPDHHPGKLYNIPWPWTNIWHRVWLSGERGKQFSLPMDYIMNSISLFFVRWTSVNSPQGLQSLDTRLFSTTTK